MGDNIGGGAPGNSYVDPRTSRSRRIFRLFHLLVRSGKRNAMRGSEGPRGYLPFSGEGKVVFRPALKYLHCTMAALRRMLRDMAGLFIMIWAPIAVVRTLIGNTVMPTTKRTPPYSLRQLTAFGLYPRGFRGSWPKGSMRPLPHIVMFAHRLSRLTRPSDPGQHDPF